MILIIIALLIYDSNNNNNNNWYYIFALNLNEIDHLISNYQSCMDSRDTKMRNVYKTSINYMNWKYLDIDYTQNAFKGN